MKLTGNYDLRIMAGEYVLMPQGEYLQKGKTPIIVNEVAAFMIEEIGKGKNEAEILSDITSEYEVDRETALPEIRKIFDIFENNQVICK